MFPAARPARRWRNRNRSSHCVTSGPFFETTVAAFASISNVVNTIDEMDRQLRRNYSVLVLNVKRV